METELIRLAQLQPSRWQPRSAEFDAAKLLELARSIQEHGLIHPVLVFHYDDAEGFVVWELVAGERRSRASVALALVGLFPQHSLEDWCARLAHVGLRGLGTEERAALHQAQTTIPAQVCQGDLKTLHVLAVIENLDRQDFSPVEEGKAYTDLAAAYQWSQREVAARVHKSQGYVAQRMACASLPAAAQAALNTRVLSLTHGRAIAGLPEPLQEPVTARVLQQVQQDETGTTTRRLEKQLHELAAFVDPARWEPNGETVYQPEQRNRLRCIQWALQCAGDLRARVEAIMELDQSQQTYGSNVLARKPIEIVSHETSTRMVLEAISGERRTETYWLASAGLYCQKCVWRETTWVESVPGGPMSPCRKRDGAQTCLNYVGDADPQVFVLDWQLRQPLARHPEITAAETAAFVYVIVPQDVVTLYEAAVDEFVQHKDQAQAREERKHVGEIQQYYEWTQSLPWDWLKHFQAHACDKCVNYAPLLAAQGDPPCRLVIEPLRKSEYNTARAVAPEFGCLVAQNGQLAPRCEAFAYAQQPAFYRYGFRDKMLPTMPQVVAWFAALLVRAKAQYSNHVLWGAFSWLDYGRKIGKNETDLARFSQWLEQHWLNLGEPAIVHLLDVAISEIELLTKTHNHAIRLVDATLPPHQALTWRYLRFPFPTDKWNRPDKWPDDWARPWEQVAQTGQITQQIENVTLETLREIKAQLQAL